MRKYYAWPALNFKSQFVVIVLKSELRLRGFGPPFIFTLPPRKEEKVGLKHLSHSCKPFVDFSSSYFSLSPHTGRFHGGKWGWKWSEKRPDSSLCLQKSTPPRTLLNPRWAFEATPTSGLILPLQRPGRGWRAASIKARGPAYCADVFPWHEWRNREGCPLISHLQRGFQAAWRKGIKKQIQICVHPFSGLFAGKWHFEGRELQQFRPVCSDLHKSSTFPSVGTKIFIFT